jgi:hypothetical protein
MLSVFLQIATTERPALVGWLGGGTGIATMNLQRAHEWVSLTAGVLGCIATVAAIVYTSVRCYYIIKKGRSD